MIGRLLDFIKGNMKTIGFYLVIVLALVRFLIYPLQGSVKEKKVLLGELSERYRLKVLVSQRQEEAPTEKKIVDKSAVFPHLFDKGIKATQIQSDVLEQFIKMAEKNGLKVMNFEIMDPIIGKGLTELLVKIRLQGQPWSLLETIKAGEKEEKVLNLKSIEINRLGADLSYFLTYSVFRLEK